MNTFPKIRHLLAISCVSLPTLGWTQDAPAANENAETDRIVIPFSSETDRSVEVSLLNGGITVRGYDGKDVIVEASNPQWIRDFKQKNKNFKFDINVNVGEDAKVDVKDAKKEKDHDPNAGLRPLKRGSTGLFAESKDNHITIGSNNLSGVVDLTLQVPYETSLKLNCMNKGDIVVDSVKGELDLENLNGKIVVNNVTGAVLAHTLNRDIVASFEKVYPDTPMSFISLNGDIDVTLPNDTKATLKMESFSGGILTNFDVDLKQDRREPTISDDRNTGGSFHMEIGQAIVGTINGGGPQFAFNTHNGDIRIRKQSEE